MSATWEAQVVRLQSEAGPQQKKNREALSNESETEVKRD